MERKPIQTKKAPAAIGPYEQAIRAGDFLFSSGQISMDPATGEMISGEIEEETERVLKNLEEAERQATEPGDREHVTPWARRIKSGRCRQGPSTPKR